MENKIYVIDVFQKLKKDKISGLPDFGWDRLVGYYMDKDSAFEAVESNCCDICECCYEYAAIEEVREGLYQPATKKERWLFQYNKEEDKYEQIEDPEWLDNYCGLTIG